MSSASRPRARVLTLAAVLCTLLAAFPLGQGASDPCAATRGADSVGHRVCLEGRTLWEASGPVSAVEAGAFAAVTWVTFDEAGLGPQALVRNGPDVWEGPLPAGRELLARGSLDGADLASAGPFRLVQLATPMLPAWMDALAARGISVHAYVPENAFLVRLNEPRAEEALDALPFVHRVLALPAEAKVELGLAAEGGAPLVNVLTMPSVPGAREATLARLAVLGAQVTQDVPAIERITARVRAEDLHALASLPEVLWIDRASETVEADMNHIRLMTGAEALQALPLPGLPFDGSGVTGMVMDVGFEAGHGDFAPCLLEVDGANSGASHGTSVFGIVCGSGAGNGLAKGMAPGARAAFACSCSGLSRYQHAQNVAERWGGVFHTNSWGRGVPLDNTYDSYSNENDRVVRDLDVLMLQSMSNFGPQTARREGWRRTSSASAR